MARASIPITEYFSQESPLATEYRRLLQNLRRMESPGELKSILVTSSVTGEGKSTISSLLAITAARKGRRTVLIDCDIRRPAIHRLFQLERYNGLVEVIGEGMGYKDVVKKTSLENLDVITAGKLIPQPSELFNTSSIDTLIRELKFYYDFLIIDSPPVIPVSDPMVLAQCVDGVILIVKAGETAREVALRSVEIMKNNQANILGVVLNNAKNRLPYYYDYSHYHYDYGPRGFADGRHGTGGRSAGSGPTGQSNPPEPAASSPGKKRTT